MTILVTLTAMSILVTLTAISVLFFLAYLTVLPRSRPLGAVKYRGHELPSAYNFVSSTAVRALETTTLVYIAPTHPDVRQGVPIVFRIFDRLGVPLVQR